MPDYTLTRTNVWNTCRTRCLLTGHLQFRLVVGVSQASGSYLPVIPNIHDHLKLAKSVRHVSLNQIKPN